MQTYRYMYIVEQTLSLGLSVEMTILAAFLAVSKAPLSTIDCVRSMRMTMSFGIDVAVSMYHGLKVLKSN